MAGETVVSPKMDYINGVLGDCSKLQNKGDVNGAIQVYGDSFCCCGDKPFPLIKVEGSGNGDALDLSFDTVFASSLDVELIRILVADELGNSVQGKFDINKTTGVITNSLTIDTTTLNPSNVEGYRVSLFVEWKDCNPITAEKYKVRYGIDFSQALILANGNYTYVVTC